MNTDNATNIGKTLGKLLEVEEYPLFGSAGRKFIQIKVEIDIKKPLQQEFWLPRDLNIDTWITL